jgi:hypothetical protein
MRKNCVSLHTNLCKTPAVQAELFVLGSTEREQLDSCIALHFARRGLKNFGTEPLREAQHMIAP